MTLPEEPQIEETTIGESGGRRRWPFAVAAAAVLMRHVQWVDRPEFYHADLMPEAFHVTFAPCSGGDREIRSETAIWWGRVA